MSWRDKVTPAGERSSWRSRVRPVEEAKKPEPARRQADTSNRGDDAAVGSLLGLGSARRPAAPASPSSFFESDRSQPRDTSRAGTAAPRQASRTAQAVEQAEKVAAVQSGEGGNLTIRGLGEPSNFIERIPANLARTSGQIFGGAARAALALGDEQSERNPLPGDGMVRDFLTNIARKGELISAAPIAGRTEWNDVKENPWLYPSLIADEIPGALAYSASMLNPVGLGLVGTSFTGSIAQERAQNDGRLEADARDVAIAAPFAAGSLALEKAGAKYLFGGATGDLTGNVATRIGKAAVNEGITEAGQSVVEGLGSSIGTERGVDLAELGDQALAGAAVGFGTGGAIRTGSEGVDATAKAITARRAARATITPEDEASPLDTADIVGGRAALIETELGKGEDAGGIDLPPVGGEIEFFVPNVEGGARGIFKGTFQDETGVGVELELDGKIIRPYVDDLRDGGFRISPIQSAVSGSTAAGTAAPTVARPAVQQGAAGFDMGRYQAQNSQIESGNRPYIKASTSSASGLFQFVKKTWIAEGGAWGPDDSKAFGGLKPSADEQRARFKSFTDKNVAGIKAIGAPVTDGNVYLAHFLGMGGARSILGADPNTPVDQILKQEQIDANKSILAGKTAGDVIAWAAQKMGGPIPAQAGGESFATADTEREPFEFSGRGDPEPSEAPALIGKPIPLRVEERQETAVVPATLQEVPVRYAVAELADLVPSNTPDGAVNPAFPAERQPRDRTRAASQNQVRNIAQNLYPRLMGRDVKASDGAPIISADGVVDSGNGRVMALGQAYAQGGQQVEAYRAMLEEEGFDTTGMTQPVMVRVRDEMPAEDVARFVRDSNARSTASMSGVETAATDAASMGSNLLGLYRGGDLDTLNNSDFVRGFVQAFVPASEAGQMMMSDGRPSANLLKRIEAALLVRALGPQTFVEWLVDSRSSKIKSIGNALIEVSGKLAQLREAAQQGIIDPAVDISANVAEAVTIIDRARREDRSVAEFVDQVDAFSGTLNPLTEAVLRIMYKDPRFKTAVSQKVLTESLNFYIEQAMQSVPGGGLIASTGNPASDILDLTNARQSDPTARPSAKPAAEQEQLGSLLDPEPGVREAGTERGDGAGEGVQAGPGSQAQDDVAPAPAEPREKAPPTFVSGADGLMLNRDGTAPRTFASQKEAAVFLRANKLAGEFDIANNPNGKGFVLKSALKDEGRKKAKLEADRARRREEREAEAQQGVTETVAPTEPTRDLSGMTEAERSRDSWQSMFDAASKRMRERLDAVNPESLRPMLEAMAERDMRMPDGDLIDMLNPHRAVELGYVELDVDDRGNRTGKITEAGRAFVRREPARTTAGKGVIGRNPQGNEVFEDENGVRSYVEGGIRVTEGVAMEPVRGGGFRMSVDPSNRISDFLTLEEIAQDRAQRERELGNQYNAIENDARRAQAKLDAFGEGRPGFKSPGIKGKARVVEKGVTENYPSVRAMKDIVRAGFFVDTLEQADTILADLKAEFTVFQDKGWQPLKDSGYLDYKLIVEIDGMKAEIQIVPATVWAVKKGEGGKLYSETRALPANDQRRIDANARQRELYGQALAGTSFESLGSADRSASGNLAANSPRERVEPSLPNNPGAERQPEASAGQPASAVGQTNATSPGSSTTGLSSTDRNTNFTFSSEDNVGANSQESNNEGENRLVSDARAEELRKRLREKLNPNRLNAGIDPETLAIGAELAVYHIEKGARKFIAMSRAIASDLGMAPAQLRQYLRGWYNGARDMMEDSDVSVDGMDSADTVRVLLGSVDDWGTDTPAPATVEPSSTVQPAAAPEANLPELARVFVDALQTRSFASITEARAFAKEATGQDFRPGTLEAKKLDEAIEAAVVFNARAIIAEGAAPMATYRQLVSLYGRQPNLAVRTSTSVQEQAYSTPAPLAYLAALRAGISRDTTVYEPSAGNGMLLITADPAKVTANELNADRVAQLRSLYPQATVTQGDATDGTLRTLPVDRIIANPPFGPVKDAQGDTTIFDMGDGYETREIDHAIVMRALDTLKNDGKAALIVGSVAKQASNREDAYNAKAKREFYFRLYSEYNVTDHFTVNGDLYKKQGAAWPVDVIVIDGRGKSALPLPAVKAPRIFDSWDALENALVEPAQVSGEAGSANSVAAGPVAGTGRGNGDAGRSGERGRADAGLDPVAQPGDVRSGDADGQSGRAGLDQREGAGRRDAAASRQDREPGRDRQRTQAQPQLEGETAPAQARYVPASGSYSLDTLVPFNMQTSAQNALTKIEAKHGSIDAYVADKLGFTREEMGKRLSAEATDAIGLALDNMDKGAAFIIGDQTGIGKGRVVASVLRYAIKEGRPAIFVTEKPNLYADIYRDLMDVGVKEMLGREPVMVMTNAGEKIPLGGDKELKSGTAAAHSKKLERIARGEEKFDILMTTYSQMQTVKGQVTQRQQVLEKMADGAIIVFDESHNAGGQGPNERRDKKAEKGEVAPNRAEFARTLARKAQGVMFSSATYAKRPEVMDLYARTDMGLAVADPKDLGEAIAKGGVPLQQVLASALADAGQYVRRERTWEGVEYRTPRVEVDEEVYGRVTDILRSIREFEDTHIVEVKEAIDKEARAEAKSLSFDGSTGGAGVSSTNFTSVMHNIIEQMLLSLKAGPAADRALEALRANRKPVITVANTMGSFIQEYADDKGVKNGGPIDLDFGAVFSRYLNRTREYTLRKPYSKEKGEKKYINDYELGENGLAEFRRIQGLIRETGFGELPISPIDFIAQRLKDEGYSVGEITGRSHTIDYSGGAPTLRLRGAKETGIAGRLAAVNGFNSGKIDAMILNQSGSTGLSLHASETFKDQRPRTMIIAQAERNIDTHMQMLGRIDRTGQVARGDYDQMVAGVPAEMRPAAVLAKKMASLNANTTGARGSAVTSEDIPDFMNEFGDEVITRIIEEDTDLERALGKPLKEGKNGLERDGAARKVTGRLMLLPLQEQQDFYDNFLSQYQSFIEQKEAAGEAGLEAKTLPLDARVVEARDVVAATRTGTPFGEAVVQEVLDVKRLGKPMSSGEVLSQIGETIGARVPESNPTSALETLRRAGEGWLADTIMQPTLTEFEVYRQRTIDNASEKAVQAIREGLNENRLAFRQLLDVAAPGQGVLLYNENGDALGGVVIKVDKRGKAKNPLALSTWHVTIATADSSRQIVVPLSQLRAGNMPEASGRLIQRTSRIEGYPVLEAFDNMQREAREKRVMFTGNILAAYKETNGKGQIVNFVGEDGSVRPGIIMRRGYNHESTVKNRPVEFRLPEQAIEWMRRGNMVMGDGVSVTLESGQIKVTTAASKAKGGSIFLNRDVIAALGTDFVKTSTGMVARAPESRSRQVFEALMRNGAKLQAKTDLAEARDLVAKSGEALDSRPEGPGLFDAPQQPERTMTQAQRAEMEARQQQGMARRGGQQGLGDQQGGLFSSERDQGSLFLVAGDGQPITPKQANDLEADLRKRLDAMGLQRVQLRVGTRETLARPGATRGPDGQYLPSMKLIRVAADAINGSTFTFNHEVVHALRDLGAFSQSDWKLLEAAAWDRNPAAQASVKARYPDLTLEAQKEEAVADMFGRYQVNSEGMTGAITRIIRRVLGIFEAIRNALQGKGFTMDRRPVDVMADIASGRTAQDIGRFETGNAVNKVLKAKAAESRPGFVPNYVGGENPMPKPGEEFIVYRTTGRAEADPLVNVNAGNAEAVADYLSNQDDADGPSYANPASHVHMYAVTVDQDFTDYVELVEGKPRWWDTQEQRADRVGMRGTYGLSFSFGERGFSARHIGAVPTSDIRAELEQRFGSKNFGYVGTVKGAAAIRSAVSPTGGPDQFADTEALDSRASGVLSLAGTQPTWKGKAADAFDKFRTAMQDRYLPMLRTQRTIETMTGESLPNSMNPYLGEELMTGRIGSRLEKLHEDMIGPLFDDMARSKVDVEELETFLYARHAPERNARIAEINPDLADGSGMSDIEAMAVMARIRKAGKMEAMERLAGKVDAMRDMALEFRVESGLMSQKQADTWRATYDYYVPLRGFQEVKGDLSEETAARINRSGGGINVRGPESKRAFGRRSRADSPLSYLILQAEEAIVRGETNRVALRFINLARANPDENFWQVNKVTMNRRPNEESGQVEDVVSYNLAAADKDWTVVAKEDGKEVRVTMNRQNPAAARLADSMRNLTQHQLDFVTKYLGTVNRFLSTVNTSYNPEFVITNAFRDMQTAAINLQGVDVPGITAAAAGHYKGALAASVKGSWGKGAGDWKKWYDEFILAGGRIYFNQTEDVGAIKKRVQSSFEMANLKAGNPATARLHVKRGLLAVRDAIENTNLGVENAVRLAAYRAAREAGVDQDKAASIAKNLTVNFNRRGQFGPVMNAAYLFYNASVQGSVRLIQAAKHRKVQKVLAGIAVAGALNELLNMMLTGDDEDGESFYDKIPAYEKSRNMIFMLGGSDYIKIPLPYGYGAVWEAGRTVSEIGRRGGDRWLESAGNLVTTIVDSFNPVGGTESLLNFVAPTIIDPIVDLTLNQDYSGRPIMPKDNPFDIDQPDAQRYFGGVAPHWRAVTDFLTEMTGGSEVEAGAIDVSPETLEHLAGVVLGAAGSFVDRNMALPGKAIEGDLEANDIPFVRKLIGEEAGWVDTTRFYDRTAEVEQAYEFTKRYIENENIEGARAYAIRNQKVLTLVPVMKESQKLMRQVREEKRTIDFEFEQGRLDDTQYKARRERVKEVEGRIVAAFNKRWNQALYPQEE